MTKVEQEESFAVNWISFNFREIFCSFFMESAKETHYSNEHSSEKLLQFIESQQNLSLA